MLFRNKTDKLFAAIARGQASRVKDLLEAGPDLEATGSGGRTPLIAAVEESQAGIVDLLLASGARPGGRGAGGESPLTAAARRGNGPVMERLIRAGADVNAADSNGQTPLMLATVWATRMASIGIEDTVQKVNLLLDAGAKVDMTDRMGRNALMASVRSGGGTLEEEHRLPVLEALMEAGTELNTASSRGRTALMSAAFRGLKDSFALLIDRGADFTLRDKSGRNALMLAAEGSFWTYRKAGYISIVNRLIDESADLTLKDSRGMTALKIARQHHRRDLASLLEKAGAYE